MNVPQILQDHSCKTCFIPVQIFFSVGLFIEVVDISAIIHQADCYYAMRRSEVSLLNYVFCTDYLLKSKDALVSSGIITIIIIYYHSYYLLLLLSYCCGFPDRVVSF